MRRAGLFGMLVPVVLAAQRPAPPGPIDTDRPDFTDGTATVPRGFGQLELGYTRVTGRRDGDTRREQTQAALLRLGVARRFELRIAQDFVTVTPNVAGVRDRRGFDDLGLGTKIFLAEQRGAAPALSVEAGAQLPTGRRDVAAHKFLPMAALLLGWEGAGRWSLGVEVAGERIPDDHLQFDLSTSLQYAATRRVQFYGEWYTFQPMPPNEGLGEHYANAGILVLLSSNVQVDASAGVGLNHAASKSYAGFGFAFRR